jgi:glycosyltransferase involved in cell wall biosynthesis
MLTLGQRSDLPAIYAAADFALSTSAFGEGFPNVIAEAMAAGLPVIATDVGDSRWIVGNYGLVTPPRDTDKLAAAVRAFASEAESVRRARGDRSRARVETELSLDRMVTAFDRLHLDGVLPPEVAQGLEPGA